MDWDDYKLVLEIARGKTLRAAASRLGLNHSTVSRRLSTLERKLGGPVFDKIVGGYQATTLGAELAAIAEEMEAAAATLTRRKNASDASLAGPLTLSISSAIAQYLLTKDIAEFTQSYPQIDLKIQSTDRFVDMDRSEADIVIRGTDNPPDHLVGRRLFPYGISFYARTGYLETTPPEKRRWIAAPTPLDRPAWLDVSPFPDAPVGMYLDDIALRHRLTIEGYGMTPGACYMADPEPQLTRLPGAGVFPRHDLWILTHPELRNSPRVRLMMDFLTKCMKRDRDLIEGNAGSSA